MTLVTWSSRRLRQDLSSDWDTSCLKQFWRHGVKFVSLEMGKTMAIGRKTPRCSANM